MEIFMFMLFFITDGFVMLICKFCYGNPEQYKDGMILGVHIPAEVVQNEEVQAICRKSRKDWNLFHLINFLMHIPVCLVFLIRTEAAMLVWMLWFVEYIAGMQYLMYGPHRAMYQLKIKNQWIREENRFLVHVDTMVSAQSAKMALSWKWHLLIIAGMIAAAVCMQQKDTGMLPEQIKWILVASMLLTGVVFMMLHRWVRNRQNIVYSRKSELNYMVNRMVKRAWSIGFLTTGILNGISWCYLQIQMMSGWIGTKEYCIFAVLQLLTVLGLLVPLVQVEKKKKEILTKDTEAIYVDDDEYWKSGGYNNPADPRILVPNRLNSMNYSFNMGRPAARIICGGIGVLTVGALVWMIYLMMALLFMNVTLKENGTLFLAEAAGYKCEFDQSEIRSVQLLDEVPDDYYFKTNGSATEVATVGYFKGKENGDCRMFLYKGYAPVLQIELGEKMIFMNSKDPAEVQRWYQRLSGKVHP